MKKITSAKLVTNDDWVDTAMTNDDMVAELLIRLKHAGKVVAENPVKNLPPLRWGNRQRRSRSSRFGNGGAVVKKDLDSVRASPKTPLSWSGGSGNRGGSASPSTSTGSRSKVLRTNESTIPFSKRLKIKQWSSELKDQENLKLKERLNLEKEITNLRATFDEQNVRNHRLKRIKLDLNSSRVKKATKFDLIPRSKPESKPYRIERKTEKFILPDLNMVPSEDEIMCGAS